MVFLICAAYNSVSALVFLEKNFIKTFLPSKNSCLWRQFALQTKVVLLLPVLELGSLQAVAELWNCKDQDFRK